MTSMPLASNRAYLKWGAVGGLAGAVLMALVMMGSTSAAGLGATAMICAMASLVLGLPPNASVTSIGAGLALHLIDGIVIGLIVVGVTLAVKGKLEIRNSKNGLLIGLLAGFVVWLVFGLPVMLFVMPPSMVDALSMMMPANGMTQAQVMGGAMTMLQGMMATLAGVFLVGHLIYGAALGTTVGYGVSRKTGPGLEFKCSTCGASFGTKDELMRHGEAHMPSKPQEGPKCPACGMTFATQQELMDHKARAHPM